MNLIKELGLEKCKQIVDGAPIGTTDYSDEDCEIVYYQKTNNIIYWDDVSDVWDEVYFHTPELKSLSELRTAIANHEKCQHDWNETTSNGDAYRFFVCKHCDSTQNYVPFEADHCTDIRNHISPNTKVIEK